MPRTYKTDEDRTAGELWMRNRQSQVRKCIRSRGQRLRRKLEKKAIDREFLRITREDRKFLRPHVCGSLAVRDAVACEWQWVELVRIAFIGGPGPIGSQWSEMINRFGEAEGGGSSGYV